MSTTILDETIIETTVDETVVNTTIDESKVETEINETIFNSTIEETVIETEVADVIGIGGTFMLDDDTKVTIINSGDELPVITQEKELLIIKNN
jgi:hypothetical protein